MKVTIDVPAPSQLVSRLRSKNRNYKTQLKQLGRAHFITKVLYKQQEKNYLDLLEHIGKMTDENTRLRNELMYAQREDRIHGCFVDELPLEGIVLDKVDADVTFDHPI